VQICSFWHKTSKQSHIFHPFCIQMHLRKISLEGGQLGARPLTGGRPSAPLPSPLEPPLDSCRCCYCTNWCNVSALHGRRLSPYGYVISSLVWLWRWILCNNRRVGLLFCRENKIAPKVIWEQAVSPPMARPTTRTTPNHSSDGSRISHSYAVNFPCTDYNGTSQISPPKLPPPVHRSPNSATCLILGPIWPTISNRIHIRSAVLPTMIVDVTVGLQRDRQLPGRSSRTVPIISHKSKTKQNVRVAEKS